MCRQCTRHCFTVRTLRLRNLLGSMFRCCQPASRPSSGRAAPDEDKGLKQSPTEVPPLGIEMMRSKSELRILQPAVSLKDGLGAAPISCSARSLWEASAYRVSKHELLPGGGVGQPDTDDHGIPQSFIEAYVGALRDHNVKWASAPDVAGMFADGVKMVGQDKSTTVGKAAVLRRLEQNTELMLKMAGKECQTPDWDLSAPRLTDEQTHEVKCTIRRGAMRLTFVLNFLIVGAKIVHLSNTRM